MSKRKNIKITLSEDSINRAIREIENYKNSLRGKIETLTRELAKIGVNSVNATMMSVSPADRGEFDVDFVFDPSGRDVFGAVIVLSGDQILFIEFSAGITFGTESGAHPKPPNNPNYGNDYGVGTYPGQTHARDPVGWWYVDKWGQAQHTYGVRAYAPMYNADIEMRNQIRAIAREIFGG